MSKVEEFYRRVISIACEVCGVDPIMMFSCKRDLSSTYKCNFLGADNKQ